MTMQMKILDLVIGSPEWKGIRPKYKVASEAAAMMGADPNFKRSDLVRMKATKVEREIAEWVEKFVFKRGHETEALARPIAEKRLEDTLYALCGVRVVEGLHLLASFDGITVPMYDLHWEHKQFNKELFALVQAEGELPPKIYWQLEHQLLVNSNDMCIFAVSDGTETNYAQMEYHSRPERRAQLIEGWKLFDKDLAAYVHEEEKPVAVADVIKDFPALLVEIVGEVKSSNLAVYKANALDFIRNIKTDLQTDDDFATAKSVVTFLETKAKDLRVKEREIISQAASIDDVVRTVRALYEEMDTKRLQLQKLVKTEETARKEEIILAAQNAWNKHYAECNSELPPNVKMPHINPDFGGAVKGKRTLSTYKEAAQNELKRVTIEATLWQQKILDNLDAFDALASEHRFLFSDLQQLILKDQEALIAIAQQRISAHQIADAARIKAEAEKIAAENERKRQEDEETKRKADAALVASQTPQEAPQAPTPAVTTGKVVSAAATPAQGKLSQVPQSAFISDRRTSTGQPKPAARVAPEDNAIITAVGIAFNVDNATALDWIAGINLAEARRLISNVG